MLLLDEAESFVDQPHGAPFSSDNGTQEGDGAAWRCTQPPSTSPSGEPALHPPSSQSVCRSRSRPASQSPAPPSAPAGTKKRSSKPAHMRRNIRKLLREHQLESGTQAAQQGELERRRRVEQHSKPDLPRLPEYTTGEVTTSSSSSSLASAAAQQREAKSIRPGVICLDSSSRGISEGDRESDVSGCATPLRSHKTGQPRRHWSRPDPPGRFAAEF